jgi:prepilin-type processing-associated H-X9-DG protein
MSKRIKRAAFTLVEMLVVIAVIMTLAMILTPALSRAKESGRAARCATNLRQLYLAAMNSAIDGGSFPGAVSSWSSNTISPGVTRYTHNPGWVAWYNVAPNILLNSISAGQYDWKGANGTACITNGALWSIVKVKDVYLCPTFALKNVCGVNNAMRSYSMNSAVSGFSMLMVSKPVGTVLFGDDRIVTNSPYDPSFATNEIGQWHSATGRVGAGQVVFVDGHVEKR